MAALLILFFVFEDSPDFVVVSEIMFTVCLVSVFMTGFLTCLLSVVRSIQLVSPLQVINWRLVNLSVAVYSILFVLLRVVHLLSFHMTGNPFVIEVVWFLMIAGVFLTVVSSNVISLLKLYFSQSTHTETQDIKRKATITIAIISVICVVCNIGFVAITGISIFSPTVVPEELFYVLIFILRPLNSACNPVVYLIRKEEMRVYVKTLCGRVGGSFRREERDNSTVLELQTP